MSDLDRPDRTIQGLEAIRLVHLVKIMIDRDRLHRLDFLVTLVSRNIQASPDVLVNRVIQLSLDKADSLVYQDSNTRVDKNMQVSQVSKDTRVRYNQDRATAMVPLRIPRI